MKLLRKILPFFFLLIYSTISLSQDESTTRTEMIASFEKGLQSHTTEYAVPNNAVSDCLNVRFNDEFGSISRRDLLERYGTTGSNKITSLHRYYKSDDTQKLLVTGGTNLWVGDDSAGTFTVLRDGLSNNKRWSWITYKDIAIGMNGTDRAIKYDGSTNNTDDTAGHRTALNMVADLGAPIADLTTGTDLSATGWYQYKIGYLLNGVYYYSESRSNAIKVGTTNGNVVLSEIPIGESGTSERFIYRTAGNDNEAAVMADTSFYLALTITDNITTTIADNLSDATLITDLSPAWSIMSAGNAVTPPRGKYCEISGANLFISGNPNASSDLYWSDNFNPDWFLATDYEPIRPEDGDEVTGLANLIGVLRVLKTNSIQNFYTSATSETNWYASAPITQIGTPSPWSVAVTPKGLMYNGRQGVYLFNGQQSALISDSVTNHIRDIAQSNIEEVAGYYWNNYYLMSYTSEESGQSINNRQLVHNLIRDTWSLDTKNINAYTSLMSGLDYGELYTGSSKTDGYVTTEGAQVDVLIVRYKSEIDAGIFDDTASFGTENAPEIELAWDLTWDTILDTWATLSTSTWARPDTNGTWDSDVYEVNSSTLDKLFWNERLNAYGDIEWQIRLSDTLTKNSNLTWSSVFTDPSGSDISGVTSAKFMQLRANLSTTNIVYTPELFVEDNYFAKVVYSISGVSHESNVLSYFRTGWREIVQGVDTFIKRITVFYQSSSGTLTFRYQNIENDVNSTFDIDLSQAPYYTDTSGGIYAGFGDQKSYSYWPKRQKSGRLWKFSIEDTGSEDWTIDRVEILYGWHEYDV